MERHLILNGRNRVLDERVPSEYTRFVKEGGLHKAAAIAIVSVGILASLPFAITAEYRRVTGPDGRFYAVATYPIWQQCVPMMPGGGGDKSGHVTIYTREGKSCGGAPVDMVWMIQDLKWSATNAELPLIAEWDLANQTVERFR